MSYVLTTSDSTLTRLTFTAAVTAVSAFFRIVEAMDCHLVSRVGTVMSFVYSKRKQTNNTKHSTTAKGFTSGKDRDHEENQHSC